MSFSFKNLSVLSIFVATLEQMLKMVYIIFANTFLEAFMESVSFNVNKSFDCDVLVIGGGAAGVAAAVSAAEEGAKVILAEQNGYLGGTATASMVGPFMTCLDTDGTKQIIKGFFDRIVSRMEQEGGAIHPTRATAGTSQTAYRTAGHIGVTPFDSECLKRVSEEMCIESGVKILYHLMFMGAENQNGNITCAYFATKGGVFKISAKVFIDCTGDADVAYNCGVPCTFGDGKGEVQVASLFFRIKGIDKEKVDKHMAENTDMRKRYYMDEIEYERSIGDFPIGRNKIMFFEEPGGYWRVNMAQVDNVDPNSPESMTDAELISRKQIVYIINFLKKYVVGCEKVELVDSAPILGIRESRHVEGDYVLTLQDVTEGVKFEDSVVCCANSLDIHRNGYVEYVTRKSKEPYYIPYRSLIAKNTENLLVAGRCISAEREVLAAVRVIPPCMAMGEAAGKAAARAVKTNTSIRNIDAVSLSKEQLEIHLG